MSASIVFLTTGSASLFTDGAGIDGEGKVNGVFQKVHISAHQNAALTGRGPVLFLEMLGILLRQAQGGFDDLAEAFPAMARKAHDALMAAVKAGAEVAQDPARVDAVLVGWSEVLGRPTGLLVKSYDHEDLGAAWEARSLECSSPLSYFSPGDGAMIDRLHAQGLDPWASNVNVNKLGLAVMREMRALTGEGAGKVGGFCQCTTISDMGVHTRIVERWPDRIGELIGQAA